MPLVDFAKRIDNDQKLRQKGLFETRFLANAYNKLRDKRNVFEKTLKYAAETDTLTNLPNRFALNEYLSNIISTNKSISVFLFDINFLKETNDRDGHKAGDDLIKRSAKCICDCFEIPLEKNCFRYGGDEFVAILTDTKKEQAEELKKKFLDSQSFYDASISIGYAIYDEDEKVDIDKLFNIADREMYIMKAIMHNKVS